MCTKHGARGNRVCKVEGCTRYPKVGGVCHAHGRPPRICCKAGCTNLAVRNANGLGRVCQEHKGVKAPPKKSAECSHEGCKRRVRGERTVCVEHAKIEDKAKKLEMALPSTRDDDFFVVCTCYSNTDTVCGMHAKTKKSRSNDMAALRGEDDEEVKSRSNDIMAALKGGDDEGV